MKTGRFQLADAEAWLEFGCNLPLEITELSELVLPALRVAADRGLTVFDACYVVLTEAEDAVLITADKPLAAAVRRSELV